MIDFHPFPNLEKKVPVVFFVVSRNIFKISPFDSPDLASWELRIEKWFSFPLDSSYLFSF